MELIEKMVHLMTKDYLAKDFEKTTIKKTDKEETKMKMVYMPEEIKPKLETGYVPALTKQEEIEKNHIDILEDTRRRATKDFEKTKIPTKVEKFYKGCIPTGIFK